MEELRNLAGIAGSLGGALPKANILCPDGLWIAKFTSEGERAPVERVEVATQALADACGIAVVTAKLEMVNSDHPVALIKRFDRRGEVRIPYISARTALQHENADGGFYSDIADVIRVISIDAERDMMELWRRMLFSILVRNTDDHLQNHGFLYAGQGRWRLARAFDVNPQPQRAPTMETGITPLTGFEPRVAAAIEAAPLFGIEEQRAREVARAMAKTIESQWRPLLQRHGVRGADLAFYADAFEHVELEVASAV